ncbi:MAG TPA: hypothetical protein DEG69_21065, partial [Flavobacteriaceae bacterium]|nr:hypothetical protein [Flavobacteriaceae bacterium]
MNFAKKNEYQLWITFFKKDVLLKIKKSTLFHFLIGACNTFREEKINSLAHPLHTPDFETVPSNGS